jgi:transcriptional regulator with XRE-family HTH domain
MGSGVLELEDLGIRILRARMERGLSQAELAERCALTQTQISYFEVGRRQPTLAQFFQISRALDVPLQRLLSGSDRPEGGLKGIASELRNLGIEDLWVQGASVPGAFRRPEEVITLALSDREPDPRIIEAIPALLAWNEINPILLRAYGIVTKTTVRLAWLADVALAIERQKGFPGGCRKEPLERFLKAIFKLPRERADWDSLGKPMSHPPISPLWKRWKINYDASLDQFEARARHLISLRARPEGRVRARRSRSRQSMISIAGKRGIGAGKKARKSLNNNTRTKRSAVSSKSGGIPKRHKGGGGGSS